VDLVKEEEIKLDEKKEIKFTDEQKRIIEFTDNALVIAAAGSGKTYTCTHKIYHLKKINPFARILYITFTKVAKEEAIDKIGKINNVTVTNFHGLAYSVLSNHKEVLKIDEIDIVNDSYCLRILQSLTGEDSNDKVRKMLEKISSIKNDCLNLENLPLSIQSLYMQFEGMMRKYKKFTYDDLLVIFRQMIKEGTLKEGFYNKILKYDYVICDEVNDTNTIQFRILDDLKRINPEMKLTLVGDLVQSIYRFRGSVPELVINYANKYNMQILSLSKNFRSQKNIIDFGNNILGIMSEFRDFIYKMNYHKDRGEKVFFSNFNYSEEQYSFVCDKIKYLNSLGIDYGDMRILFRKNASGSFFERAAVHNRIPFKLLKGSLIERKVVSYILNCIRIAKKNSNKNFDEDFENLMGLISFELAPDIGKETFDLVKKSYTNINIIDRIKNIGDLKIKGIGPSKIKSFNIFYKKINNLFDVYSDFSDNHSELINNIGKIVLGFKYFSRQSNAQFESTKEDIEELSCLIEEMDGDITDKINSLSVNSLSKDVKDKDFIYGMTVHQAKGTESKVVFIIDAHDFPLPFTIGDRGEHEEKRIFYVAVTRAMENLYLTSCGDFHYANELLENSEFLEVDKSCAKF